LEEEDPEMRAAAAEALGKIGASELAAGKRGWAKSAYRALLFFSQVDRNDQVQRAAHAALDRIREPAAEDVSTLLSIVTDKQQPLFFRTAAAQVVGMIGPAIPKNELPRLGQILKSTEESGIRSIVAHALAEIGPEAETQAPALVHCLKDEDSLLRAAAVYALGEILTNREAPEVAAALRELIKDSDDTVRNNVHAALKKIRK
jgi:HEAT repeat protein